MTVSFSQYFLLMDNVIQDYSWGSRTAIPLLFDKPNPNNKPLAEMWMGAHPNGCSKISFEGKLYGLSDFINQDKAFTLSDNSATKFEGLPYLFKVLAAEQSLSVQVHPSKKQAKIGFAKEELAGIPRTAANRNYKDPNHKPELVYALTPYQAMNGFREYDEILSLFQRINVDEIKVHVETFLLAPNAIGLETFFVAILSLEGEEKENAIKTLVSYASLHQDNDLFKTVIHLSKQHADDIGLFSPLILNVITLQPGEAMFLYACTPHAYIKGTGLEIMANSDNVLRAGLTPKYIDVEELVFCTRFQPTPFESLLFTPEYKNGGLYYDVPVDDFKFLLLESVEELSITTQSAEILLALDAEVILTHQTGETSIILKGESVFIPAYTGEYQLTSSGRVARAFN